MTRAGLRDEEREAYLLARIARVVGYVPTGTTDLLHVLRHPDVEEAARDYLGLAAPTADLAAQVARVAEDARLVVLSFREVEDNRQLYDAATHRCVDLLADSLAALSLAQPDTEPTR